MKEDSRMMSDFYIVSDKKLMNTEREEVMRCCEQSFMPVSGKKDRVLISCLTFGVPVVVDPAVYYGAERIHILHYIHSDDDEYKVYQEFYDEACKQLKNKLPKVEIVEHNISITEYRLVLRELLRIVRSEDRFTDIYVNISAGTSEYSAAAMLVCMQYSNLTAFTVRSKEYALKDKDIKRLLYKDGRPVGLRLQVHDPVMITTFDPEKQDMDLIAAMVVIRDIWKSKNYATYEEMIDGLIEAGVWKYNPNRKRTKTDDLQKKRQHFKRNYLDPMMEKGWLAEDPIVKRRYRVTDKGQAVIDVYYEL